MAELQWHPGSVHPEERRTVLGHGSACLWLTGLPAAGKSTIARALERRLVDEGVISTVLDGDNLRLGLCAGLDFSPAGRTENLRRAAHAARLLMDAGVVVIAAFVSPRREDRQAVADVVGEDFLEVHVATPPTLCAARDRKGLWARAERGELQDFTGVSAPYDPPSAPALRLETDGPELDDLVGKLHRLLRDRGVIPAQPKNEDPG